MKQIVMALFVALFVLGSCNSGKSDDKDVVYEYTEKSPELSEFWKEKIGSWAEQGSECYGILVLTDKNGTVHDGSVIRAKIVRFNGDSIKMKSLVDIKMKEVEGCSKLGISRGETWWETEGDIYQTEEQARARLESLLSKPTV